MLKIPYLKGIRGKFWLDLELTMAKSDYGHVSGDNIIYVFLIN